MVKSDKKAEKVGVEGKTEGAMMLEGAMVRIAADKPEYVKMEDGGFFVAVGAPRVPKLHSDIRALLISALRKGAALFSTAGGIRVMAGPNGKGGLFFIEKGNMMSGKEIFLFSCKDRQEADDAGLVSTRGGKGVYVSPRNKEGKTAFGIVAEKFNNTRRPNGFKTFEWEGYKVSQKDIEDDAKEAKKPGKKSSEGKGGEKKIAKGQEKDGPEKKPKVEGKKSGEKDTAAKTPEKAATGEKRVVKKVPKGESRPTA